MELKPGYKQTEVGVIPEDWRICQLGEVCSVLRGGSPRPIENYLTDREDGINWIKIGDVGLGAKYIDATSEKILPSGISRSRCVKAGDFLLSNSMSFGRPYILRTEGCIHDGWLVIGDYQESFSTEYLYYCLSSNSVLSQYARFAAGSSVLNLNKDIVSKVHVAVPEPKEQRSISQVLGDLDNLLGELEKLITKKRNIKQAAMQELLTGKRRLPGFEGEWEVKRLGDVAHIKTGSRNNEDKNEDGEYPFFVRSDNIERINSYSYDCEAILVPGEGRIGEIFHYANGRFDVHQRVYAITQFKPGVSGKFVHSYMAMNFGAWAMQNTVKATVDSLRLPTFKTFEMLVPPTEDEQDAIADVLSGMDAELAALEAHRDKTRALKQGMMQELLTGRRRLK